MRNQPFLFYATRSQKARCNVTVTQRNAIDKNRVDKNRKDKSIKHIRNQIPPTRDMVQEYITENGYRVDADTFMDYYESKGWYIGKNKMKDWQASVRNWNRNEHGKPSSNPYLDMLKAGGMDD